ncbi:MAG TPA: ABC transporter ATP-binding protein [Verrucomicrobiae bacterium]|nr:ABC transporter ATP-binding protein [Verrucomicrobiae bacterium]
MPALLQLDKATIRFGGLTAVSELDLQIRQNELVGLIGPNGAGKTTAFNLITGVYQPTNGGILFDGQTIVGSKPYHITARGIARTFQNIRLFPSLTVFDNVRAVFHLHLRGDIQHALWRGKNFHDEEKFIADRVLELLDVFQLGKFRDEPAKSLSYGDQRRLEIVRALAAKPKLLLLDEPAAGMNSTEKVELTRLIRFIRDKFQIAILLVEHDMQLMMGICERIAVLDYGIKIAEGTPDEIRKNPKVIAAYLGE